LIAEFGIVIHFSIFIMYCSMNYTDQSNSMQYAFDSPISGSRDSSRSDSDHTSHLEPEPAMDGRSFYPVTDDLMYPMDIVLWDRSMEIEEFVLATLLKTTKEKFVVDGLTPSTMHVKDGESSDTSSVSTEIFESSLAYDLEPHSVVFPSSGAPPSPNQLSKMQHLSSPTTHRKSMAVSPFASLISSHKSQNDDSTSDDEVSLSAIVSSQDHRFKPFHEEKWNQRYDDLLAFHKQNGHSAVPHTYPPHQQLARWIKR
jgi:hypothetical protein